MDQAEYNAKVQDMQRFAIECGLQHRVRPEHDRVAEYGRFGRGRRARHIVVGDFPKIERAVFEVYYGDWRKLGEQFNPMTPDVRYQYNEYEDSILRAEVARDLCK